VPVNQVVNLRTQDIPNDNVGGALFRYDRAQLLGYFVKGTGLAGGEALFPEPAP